MMIYINLSIVTGLAGVIIYIYFLRDGQFEDDEEVKYQLFHEEEDENNRNSKCQNIETH
jgi:cbb3-type cytochrome oxidase maturation protein